MSPPLQFRLRCACALVCAFALWSGDLIAASFIENRDYATALKAFRDNQWGYAELRFAQFAAEHPKSERLSEALLYQARAQFEQGKFGQVVTLLTGRLGDAGQVSDRYLYWIGKAQFASTHYAEAAETFSRMGRDFPGSARRLAATVEEAAARAKLDEWPRVIELLKTSDGSFQQSVKTNASNETVARGRLLLAEAGLAQKDYPIAEAALQPLATQTLRPELDWQRRHLLCRVELGLGRTNGALTASDELVTAAGTTGRRDLLAESIALNADILEQIGRPDEAATAFERNLDPQTPAEFQRRALLKIAALAMTRNRPGDAIRRIGQFLQESANAAATDATALARLTLGELYLKEHAALTDTNRPAGAAPAPPTTNLVELALTNFDRVIAGFTNDALVGKAYLDRGWCFWSLSLSNQTPVNLEHLQAGTEAFSNAVERLPPSEDRTVARFKLADTQFAQNDFANALENYRKALDAAAEWPAVREELSVRASYQMLQASLNLTNMTVATNVMEGILLTFPEKSVAESSLLLVGQGYADLNEPGRAREQFMRFIELFPDSLLRPEVELAVARTQEQRQEWTDAIGSYNAWLERFPASPLRPRAEFQRAWVNYQAGNETNALNFFTNFLAQFATHPLAPQAQWWVADYYFGHGDYVTAEKNYKLLFQKWPTANLAYQARLMAGRAALGSQLDFRGAIDHFTNLTSNPNCPGDVWRDAMFAYGGALMLRNSGDTNNPSADLNLAIKVFGKIQERFADTEGAAIAWGEMGNCYLQLAAQDASYYTNAIQAYQQTTNSLQAGIVTRSLAQIGLGATLEALARNLTGEEQKSLLKQALANYLDVLYGKNLRENEVRDPACIKQAGLKAAQLAEVTQDVTQSEHLYRTLRELLPPLKESLERRIQKAQEREPPAKK